MSASRPPFPSFEDEDDDSSNVLLQDVWDEIKLQVELAWPTCLSFILRKSTDIISVIFIGHLGSEFLSSAGLASVTANVTGNSAIYGLSGALGTICSQAVGMRDIDTMSVILQRAIIILLLFIGIPIGMLWYNSEPILVQFGQEPQLAHNASEYLKRLIPGNVFLCCIACIQNWLYAQSKTRAVATVTLITAILHPLWCYLTIHVLGYGFLGAAISVSITKAIELTLLIVYMTCFSNVLHHNMFSWQFTRMFQDWGKFLILGLPNLLMMLDWWASEIIIFLSGTLPNPQYEVSAMSVYQNVIATCYMIPSGFHVAATTRVGNSLGENAPEDSKLAACISVFLSMILSMFASGSIGLWHRNIAYLFTDDNFVINAFSQISMVLVGYVIADGMQTALAGSLKGLGKQYIGAPVVIFSYYCVGIPVALYCAFKLNYGLLGLVLGTLVAKWVHVSLYGLVLYHTDWAKEAQLVHSRKKAGLPPKLPLPKPSSTAYNPIRRMSSGDDEFEHIEVEKVPLWIQVYNSVAAKIGGNRILSEHEIVRDCTDSFIDDAVL